MKNEIATTNSPMSVNDISTVSKTFYESGMFADCKSAAQAMVKIMAGAEVGLPAFQSMSGIHIIAGKPVIGSGLIAAKIKGSGKYDYRVTKSDAKECSVDIYQGQTKIGTSSFTIEEAKNAGTKNLDKFPKNMLFARAISNAVKFYCPDVFAGPVYVPEEMESVTEETTYTEVTPEEKPLKPMAIGSKAFNSAVAAIRDGKTLEDVIAVAKERGLSISMDVENEIMNAVEQAA